MAEPQVTQLLGAWRDGDVQARDRLVSALYPELRRIAQQVFRREARDHTLQPTALVNEAWLRLSGGIAPDATDRAHLLAITARLMREILVDHARRRRAAKRDGGERISLTHPDCAPQASDATGEMLELDRALQRLEQIDPVKARIVELRYFGGLGIEETGAALGQSPATVKRHWQAARLWLHGAINGPATD